jgi:hypothetical protein
VGKPEEKRQHERPRLRWQDNTKTDQNAISWEGLERINLCQGS